MQLSQTNPSPLEAKLHKLILDHLSRLEVYNLRKGRAKSEIIADLSQDPLYSIFGLDTPEYVAALLSGGTVTSIHRKLGDLYEQCVQLIITHQLNLPLNSPRYSAQIASGDRVANRALDVFIPFESVETAVKSKLVEIGTREIAVITRNAKIEVVGFGFEVRHCYQSADSKRIQADEAMARHLLLSGILPFMLIFCNQSNRQIITRYIGTWLVKEGNASYQFLDEIAGFKLYNFLVEHKNEYREMVRKALQRITE